jgi:hypothetical protein
MAKKSVWQQAKESVKTQNKTESYLRMNENTRKTWPKEVRADPGIRTKKTKPPVGKGGR